MPKPVCSNCSTTESMLWRPLEEGYICNDCFNTDNGKSSPTNTQQDDTDDQLSGEEKGEDDNGQRLRKSTRSTRYKSINKESKPAKGRGRRSFFKQRIPNKAPTTEATIVTSDSVYHRGLYRQIGDIVSLLDVDGGIYYAQIRGFLTDQYCEKSAVITWLLPTTASSAPEQGFDPATYIIGPEEDLPRKLDCMEFVMHAPSDYYKSTTCPYPPLELDSVSKVTNGFIWTTVEPVTR